MTMQSAKRRLGRSLLVGGVLTVLGAAVGTLAAAAAGAGPEGILAPPANASVEPAPEAGVQPPDRRGGRRGGVRERWRARRGPGYDRRGARGEIASVLLFGPRLARELELTDEQRDRIRDTLRTIRDERADARAELRQSRRALMEAARNSEATEAEIRELGEAMGRSQADRIVARRGDRERVLAILTDEQRSRLETLREEREERRDRGPRRYRDRRDGRRG